MNIRAIIVDDEAHARDYLERLLGEYCSDVEVIGKASSIETGEQLITKLNPDLLFLDIKLASTTSFELLNRLDSQEHSVIFVTAYNNYALKAIKFSALDYILKPINPQELIRAVTKYKDEKKLSDHSNQLKLLIQNLTNERAFEKLVVHSKDHAEFLKVKRIIRLQGENNYTRIFLDEGRNVLISKTLAEFEELLNDLGFLRVHKTHIVNIDYVKEIKKNGDICLLLSEGSILPVSRRRKAAVTEKIYAAFKLR